MNFLYSKKNFVSRGSFSPFFSRRRIEFVKIFLHPILMICRSIIRRYFVLVPYVWFSLVYFQICLSICLFLYLHLINYVCFFSVYSIFCDFWLRSMWMSVLFLQYFFPVCLPTFLCILWLSVRSSTWIFNCLSVCLPICLLECLLCRFIRCLMSGRLPISCSIVHRQVYYPSPSAAPVPLYR